MKNTFDTVICGGGVAGIAAALSSARLGARTCLIEKGYALGGLATLGLVVVYLPLDDGCGVKMSGGICEELALASIKYGPGKVPDAWADSSSSIEARSKSRYQIRYEAAPFMIAAEELLLENGVTVYYDTRLAGARVSDGKISSVTVDTKLGAIEISAKAFVDATGDADLCFFAGEKTVECGENCRTGWYFSFTPTALQAENGRLSLHGLTDPFFPCDPSKPHYTGLDPEDISNHMTDMRKLILSDVLKRRKESGEEQLYPLIIPAFHGLRTTRRLSTSLEFSGIQHNHVWFSDAMGMVGNWRKSGCRYSLPYRALKAENITNLYAAGRCVCADVSGWDITRVIPTCAVSGEASGIAVALQAKNSAAPTATEIQSVLKERNVPLEPALFSKTE